MRLAQALEQISAIETCTIDSVNSSEYQALTKFLSESKKLSKLTIKDSFFDEDFMARLGNIIGENNSVVSFAFDECNFSERAVAQFAGGLARNNSITTFKLLKGINDEDIATLIEALGRNRQSNLESLVLKDCVSLNRKSITALAQLIQNCPSLKKINLKGSYLSSNLTPIIAAYRQSMQLIAWSFEDCDIDDAAQLTQIELLSAEKKSQYVAMQIDAPTLQKEDKLQSPLTNSLQHTVFGKHAATVAPVLTLVHCQPNFTRFQSGRGLKK